MAKPEIKNIKLKPNIQISQKKCVAFMNKFSGVKGRPKPTNVEEFWTGVEYAQVLHILFPKFFDIKKVKIPNFPRGEYASQVRAQANLHYLKRQIDKLGINARFVNTDALLKRNVPAHYMFQKWLIKFFIANKPKLLKDKAVMIPKVANDSSYMPTRRRRPKSSKSKTARKF